MKTGIIILSRFSSSRLPGKVLRPLHGKPLLSHIINRLKVSVQASGNITIATSNEPSDDAIEEFCDSHSIHCYRGNLNDVAGRFLNAAEELELDYAVRINGDNLFIDTDLLDFMLKTAITGEYDFLTNVPGRTYPFGMSIEIISIPFLKKVYEKYTEEKYKEHVTLYLYDNPDLGKRKIFINKDYPEAKGLKLAVDTLQDFELLGSILSKLNNKTNYSLQEIISIYKTITEQ